MSGRQRKFRLNHKFCKSTRRTSLNKTENKMLVSLKIPTGFHDFKSLTMFEVPISHSAPLYFATCGQALCY